MATRLFAVLLFALTIGADDSPLVRAAQRGPMGERFRAYSRLTAGMRAPALAVESWINTPRAIAIGERPLLLNFTSVTCGRCADHRPRVEEIARSVTVISIYRTGDSDVLRQHLQKTGVRSPVAIDSGATRAAYGVTGMPTYFFIGRDGTVILKTHAPPSDRQLQQLLGDTPAAPPRSLADIAGDVKLKASSITIDPVQAGERFRGIVASDWLNGPALSADQLRGRVLLIDFWAVWCRPCLEKIDVVQRHADRFGSALVVIGVHYKSDRAPVEQYLAQRRLRFPIAIDTGETWQRWSLNYIPTYLLVDQQGIVRSRSSSPPSDQEIAALVAER